MPKSVEICSLEHAYLPTFDEESKVKSITIHNESGLKGGQLSNMLNSLENCHSLKSLVLREVSGINTINGISKLKFSNINNFQLKFLGSLDIDISDLGNFKLTEEEKLQGKKLGSISKINFENVITTTLPDLSNLGLNNLTMTNCGLEDIEGLIGCAEITNLNLSNNKIQNLKPIKDLQNLTTLNLSHNNIYNIFRDSVNDKMINNLSILSDLKENHSLVTLNVSYNYLDNNDDLEKLKKLFSENGDFSNQVGV